MEHEAAALMQGDRQDGAEQKGTQRCLGDLGARCDDDLAPLAHQEAADPGPREAGPARRCAAPAAPGEAAYPPPPDPAEPDHDVRSGRAGRKLGQEEPRAEPQSVRPVAAKARFQIVFDPATASPGPGVILRVIASTVPWTSSRGVVYGLFSVPLAFSLDDVVCSTGALSVLVLGARPVRRSHSASVTTCHTTNASCSDSVSSSRRQAARTAPSSTYGAIAAASPKTTSLSAAVCAPSSARTKFGPRSDLPPRQRTASGRIPAIAPRNTQRVQPSRSF